MNVGYKPTTDTEGIQMVYGARDEDVGGRELSLCGETSWNNQEISECAAVGRVICEDRSQLQCAAICVMCS